MKSEILNKEFNFKAIHVGLFVDDRLWQHDKWTVIIEGQTFEYSTGIGNRKALTGFQAGHKNWKGFKDEATYYLNSHNWKRDKENLTEVNKKIEAHSKVMPLNIDDVLYSLIMDSEAANEMFEDWCDNYGYDTDSRKALETYEACQKNTKKLLTFIGDLDKARELFQDY